MHVLDWIRAHTQRASARHGDSVSVVWNNNNNKNSLRSLCVHVDSHNIKAAAVAATVLYSAMWLCVSRCSLFWAQSTHNGEQLWATVQNATRRNAMYFSLYLNRNIPIDDVCDEQVHDTHTTHYVYEYWTTKKNETTKIMCFCMVLLLLCTYCRFVHARIVMFLSLYVSLPSLPIMSAYYSHKKKVQQKRLFRVYLKLIWFWPQKNTAKGIRNSQNDNNAYSVAKKRVKSLSAL